MLNFEVLMIVITGHLRYMSFYRFMSKRGMLGSDYHVQASGYGVDGQIKVTLLSQRAKDLEAFLILKFG